MEQEPRKATDVLLDLESKIDGLIGLVRSQDLVIKVLSNKLNDVLTRLDKQQAGPPRIVVETVQTPVPPQMPLGFKQLPAGDPERNIPFIAESQLPQENSPQGFRRNSRPETFVKEKSQPQPPPVPEMQMPMQLPPGMNGQIGRQAAAQPPPGRGAGLEVPTAQAATPRTSRSSGGVVMAPPQPVEQQASLAQGQIPVTQRCVDKNGKSIFLADVEIVDASTMQAIFKTRTNGTGKWMASLGIGAYRVTIRKRESLNKEKLESVQDIQVDGSSSKLELPMMIIK